MTAQDDFDSRYGVETAAIVPRWRLLTWSLNAIHGSRYQATGESELLAALDFIQEDFSTFTFIDLGCGKGRALVIAEQRGFRQVMGVEYNKPLADIARRNVVSANVVHGDAADFAFPRGNIVLFLYNPFSSKVMTRVVDRVATHAGNVYVIYKHPKCAALFDDCAFLSPLGKIPNTIDFFAWTNQRP